MKYCRARTYTSHTNPLQLHLLHGVLIYFDCIFVCVCVLVKEERHLCLTVYPPQTGDSFDSVSVLPAWHRRKKKKSISHFPVLDWTVSRLCHSRTSSSHLKLNMKGNKSGDEYADAVQGWGCGFRLHGTRFGTSKALPYYRVRTY